MVIQKRRTRPRHDRLAMAALLLQGVFQVRAFRLPGSLGRVAGFQASLRSAGVLPQGGNLQTRRHMVLGQQETPDIWYKDGVPFKCTACGKCCKTRGDVWLNPDEVKAAANATRLDPEGFIEIYSAEVVKGWVRLRDRRSPDGVADGACIFLDNNNQCSIYEARPLQCRTYPYWPRVVKSREAWNDEAVVEDDKEGRHWNVEDGGCEGINHPDSEIVDFVHIRKELIKQAYYYQNFPL